MFLSDVPVDVTVHGSFFVMAHFHYTIMGGLIFAFFGGLYYWLPKITGQTVEPDTGRRSTSTLSSSFSTARSSPCSSLGSSGKPRHVSSTPATCRL